MSIDYDYERATRSYKANEETRGRSRSFQPCPRDPFPLTGRKMSSTEARYHLYRHRGDILFHFMAFNTLNEGNPYSDPHPGAIKVARLSLETFIETNAHWSYYCFQKFGIMHFMVLDTNSTMHHMLNTPQDLISAVPHQMPPIQQSSAPVAIPTSRNDLSPDDKLKLMAYTAYTKFRNDIPITQDEFIAIQSHPDTMYTEVARAVHMNSVSTPDQQITSAELSDPWIEPILQLRGRIDLGGSIPTREELASKKPTKRNEANTDEDNEDWSDGYGTEDLTD